ncbi:MAG: 5'/3'-nucleotidase SurE [Halothiobacillaceae bacterium]|nr:5'/3'-nucleotidase SurE [Halothiobacillaceae bacterium]
MNILISNDDGVYSPGIRALLDAMRPLGQVTIVAPDRDRSGASNSLTLARPLRPRLIEPGIWSVDGTPTDCVHLALTGLLDFKPDIVISGINHGANMGDDVLYSGTVAAATEGRSLGLPAIALSMDAHEPQHLATAGRAAQTLVQSIATHCLPPDTLLNVNIPDRPWAEIQGLRATRLGKRHPSAPMVPGLDPRGKPIYWVGPAGAAADEGEGTDFSAVREGWVSVTPIHFDMTRYEALTGLAGWLPDVAAR